MSLDDPYAIYVLEDPRYILVRYVGITNDPFVRFSQHINCTDDCNPKKDAWVQELKAQMLLPLMRIVALAEGKSQALRQEATIIQKYLEDGVPLFNIVQPIPHPPAIAFARCKVPLQFFEHVKRMIQKGLDRDSYRLFYPMEFSPKGPEDSIET